SLPGGAEGRGGALDKQGGQGQEIHLQTEMKYKKYSTFPIRIIAKPLYDLILCITNNIYDGKLLINIINERHFNTFAF
ncbi:Hypothetical protein FKW44_002439, partial [Caligus rogercresseyi]